jgi:hypothetical protein
MGFFKSLRDAIAGPPRVRGAHGEAGEVSTVFHEEYAAQAPEEESKQIDQLSKEPEGPAGAAPFAAGTFLSSADAAIGPEREAQIDEPLETLEGESEPEEERDHPGTGS